MHTLYNTKTAFVHTIRFVYLHYTAHFVAETKDASPVLAPAAAKPPRFGHPGVTADVLSGLRKKRETAKQTASSEVID